MLQPLFDWWPWLLGGAGAVGLGTWFLGLGPVLAFLGPVVGAALQGVFAFLGWVWTHIIWPGLKDIGDSLATVLLVAGMLFGLWFVMDRKINSMEDRLTLCQTDLRKARKTTRPEPAFQWLDNLFRF